MIFRFSFLALCLLAFSCNSSEKKQIKDNNKNLVKENYEIVEAPSLFADLTRVSVDTVYDAYFSYDKKAGRIINKFCSQLDTSSPFHCYEDSVLATWTLLARIKMENLPDSLNIIYSDGLSADPAFEICDNSGRQIAHFSCLELFIKPNGEIYTSGHNNNMYDRRRKYQFVKDTVVEAKQPFNYVGLQGKIKKDIKLYSDTTSNKILAQLPKGSKIEILLAKSSVKDFEIDKYFLVKTEFGLIGWLKFSSTDKDGNSSQDIYGNLMDGFYYAGD